MAGEGFYGITVADNEGLDDTLTLRDTTGASMNLTGYTAAAGVKDLSGDVVLTFRTTPGASDGTLTLGGSAGTVRFQADDSLIADIGAGYYWYDLILYDGSGVPAKGVHGTFVVDAGVTSLEGIVTASGLYAGDAWQVFGPLWTGR